MDVLWDITSCGSGKDRRFEEHIVFILRMTGLAGFLACSEDMPHGGGEESLLQRHLNGRGIAAS